MSPHVRAVFALALSLCLGGCQGQDSVGAEEPKSKPASPPPREVKVTPVVERTIEPLGRSFEKPKPVPPPL